MGGVGGVVGGNGDNCTWTTIKNKLIKEKESGYEVQITFTN